MQILHLDLKLVQDNFVELRYFSENPNQYQRRNLPLSEIADLIQLVEQDYYVRLAVDYAITGRKLYNWLDGSDRFLQGLLDRHRGEGIVLAIAAVEKLAHLPWEVLNDGKSFLVEQLPAIVPVRWVSSDTVKKLSIETAPENRALQVLFVATSPLAVEPVLDFEAEEGRILEVTARQPLGLTVEESGCLSELGYLVDDYGKGYFDVLHLTGHAALTDEQPRFVTETETGEAYYASAVEIARELQFRLPKLIFLSGCRTGQAGKAGVVPSMAEELLKSGAKAVLGWGQKVLDTDAKESAAALYQSLSAGKQLTEAVAFSYQALIKNKARDWHLLRLYVAGTLPGELVTPLRTRGRKSAPPPSVVTQFLDSAGKVKVPTRESFVGRRRQLQNCLRVLTQSADEAGVLIHGMGGLGKSSLAARLCDRLSNFERVVWVGRVDEPSLVSRLAEKLGSKELRQAIQDPDEELKFRLKRVFRQLEDETAKPFLLVLDDFEHNLEPRNEVWVVKPETAEILEALVWAIRETYAPHRLILTCRYDFESTRLQYFYKQPLEALRGADLQKKCNRLTAFGSKSQVDEALQSQAKRLADGNPRLLEWLNKILQNSTVDQAAILNRLEADPVELREQVLAEALLEQMDQPMREMLQRGLVFELPVPREAITAVCEGIPNLEQQIDRAVALGLLEVSPDESLRVPRIVPLKLLEDAEALYKQAAEALYSFWWKIDMAVTSGTKWPEVKFSFEIEMKPIIKISDEECFEIHRLALLGKQTEIAVVSASLLSNRWIALSRYFESVKLCEITLKKIENHRILYELSKSEIFLGKLDDALKHAHEALKCCPNGDIAGDIFYNLVDIYTIQGQFEEANNLIQQVLELDEFAGQDTAALSKIANIYFEQGKLDEALVLYQKRLKHCYVSSDAQDRATTLYQIACIYTQKEQFDKALDLLKQSLQLSESLSDIQGIAANLHERARILDRQGKVEEAIALLQQSLELKERMGDAEGRAASLSTLGQLLAEEREDFTTGLAYLEESLEIYKKLKSPQKVETIKKMIAGVQQQQAVMLHNTAVTKVQQRHFDEALALYKQSLELTEGIGDIQNQAVTLGMLGQLLADAKGDLETGLDYLQQSLEMLQRLQSPEIQTIRQIITRVQRRQAFDLYNRARIEVQQEQPEEAIALFEQSLALTERIGDVHGRAATLVWLGQLLADEKEDFDKALNYLQQSLEIFKNLQSPDAETVREVIAKVQQMRENLG